MCKNNILNKNSLLFRIINIDFLAPYTPFLCLNQGDIKK